MRTRSTILPSGSECSGCYFIRKPHPFLWRNAVPMGKWAPIIPKRDNVLISENLIVYIDIVMRNRHQSRVTERSAVKCSKLIFVDCIVFGKYPMMTKFLVYCSVRVFRIITFYRSTKKNHEFVIKCAPNSGEFDECVL